MPNPETQEKASLYVLGLMSPAEREEFEAEQEANPTLQAEVRDFQINVEALALAAAPLTAPAGCYEKIQERIEGGILARWSMERNAWIMLGWPLAAALALSWVITSYHFSSSKTRTQTTQSTPQDHSGQTPVVTPSTETTAMEEQYTQALERQRLENARLQDALKKEQVNKLTILDRLGRQDARTAQLEDRVRSLTDVQPGMNRLLVFNLRDPRTKSPVLNVLDDASHLLAHEANKRLAPSNLVVDNTIAGFNSPSLTPPNATYDTEVKTDTTRSPTVVSNQNAYPINTPPPLTSFTNMPLTGVVVYDQAALNGYLVMNGVSGLADNQNFQLWVADEQTRLNIGLLPRMSNGILQVNFKLDFNDFVPNRFFVTVEPWGGSPQPSGPVVLDGPGN